MNFGFWVALIILIPLLIVGLIMWWTAPDELDAARQRERALKTMEKWSK